MVQVPRLNRIQTQSDRPDQTRLNVGVRDNSVEMRRTGREFERLTEQGIRLYEEIENDKIRQYSYEAERELKEWSAERLNNLRTFEGDPTTAYAEFEQEEEEKFNEILNRREGLSERVRGGLEFNLSKVRDSQRLQVIRQRELQKNVYKENLYNSTLQLKRQYLPDHAAYINAADPVSFVPFEKNLAEIKTVVAQRGIDTGTVQRLPADAESWDHVYEDADGQMVKVKMSNPAKLKAAKELSQGVAESVDVLINSGYVDKAEAMKERYKEYIDPRNLNKLETKLDREKGRNEANNLYRQIQYLPDDEMKAKIRSIDDPKLRQEVRKFREADVQARERETKRKQDANYSLLSNRVMDGNITSLAALESDPLYKQTWDNLSSKQKKTIRDLVKPPKESNPKSAIEIQDLFFGNNENFDINTISPEQFNTFLEGLSKSDQTKYRNMYLSLRTDSNTKELRRMKSLYKYVKDELFEQDEIDLKDQFDKFDPDEKKMITRYSDELFDMISETKGAYSEKELKDIAKDFVVKKIKDETFRLPQRKTGTQVQTETQSDITPEERKTFKQSFYREFGRFPRSNDAEFNEYVRKIKNANR